MKHSPRPAEPPPPLDHVVFRSRIVTVGAFRCPTWHPEFQDSGPAQNHIFVFPRQTVWLCHEGGRPFLADPGVVTLYNRGQRYARAQVSAVGDHCEWFAVEAHTLVDAVSQHDAAARDRPEHPFCHTHGPCGPRTYLAQRRLFEDLRAGVPLDPLCVEERVMVLLGDVLDRTYAFWGRKRAGREPTKRQNDAVEAARAVLAERLDDPLHLDRVAAATGLSVYHLCRAFRALTGSTLHAYRDQMRLQSALATLEAGDDITRVALDLGYSSHSHFTWAFRRRFGVPPSAWRRARTSSRLDRAGVSARGGRRWKG